MLNCLKVTRAVLPYISFPRTSLKINSRNQSKLSDCPYASPSVQIPPIDPKCLPQLLLYLPGSISSTVQSGWVPQGPSCPCYGGHPGWRWLCCCRWGHGSTASSPSLLPPSSGRRQRMPPRWWGGSGSPSHTPCLQREKMGGRAGKGWTWGEQKRERKMSIYGGAREQDRVQ